jgi:hypothetical protein
MRVVDALFNPEYATVQEAIRRINGGAVSVAISPQVALAGDGKGVFAVYYRDTMVGGMQNGVYVPVVTGRCSDMAKRLVEEALV